MWLGLASHMHKINPMVFFCQDFDNNKTELSLLGDKSRGGFSLFFFRFKYFTPLKIDLRC